ncbi:MAG: tetratricopeptide repeat protein [Rickettsiales bacterium]|jgi:tetratricopeptide (TPR) repeat protein
MPNKESSKKKSFVKKLQESVKKEFFKEVIVKKLLEWKKQIFVFITKLKKIRDVSKNNYELGKKHYDLGNFDDAIMRFKLVTWMDSKKPEGWYWLGASYAAENKKKEASESLKKALELKPSWQEARDMLKALSSAD